MPCNKKKKRTRERERAFILSWHLMSSWFRSRETEREIESTKNGGKCCMKKEARKEGKEEEIGRKDEGGSND